jgi:hypothetical protein
MPGAVVLHRLHELIGDANRVIAVLTGDGEVGFAVPVGIVLLDASGGVALSSELEHAFDAVGRNQSGAGLANGASQIGVALPIQFFLGFAPAVNGFEDSIEMATELP